MARRYSVLGFNTAGYYCGSNTPNDGNLTISSTHFRTGTSALRVNAQSATRSTLQVDVSSGGGTARAFLKGWYYFISFPSSPRDIIMVGTGNPLTGYPEMRIDSTGHLSVGNNGTRLTTGSTALSLNTWYCIELGINTETLQASIRINDGTEIDWTAYTASGGPGGFNAVYVGAADTATGAFEYYLDDFETDWQRWCGTGYVITTLANSIVTDNANWTANTGTKANAIATIDDDTTYLISSTTTGSGTDIYFGFPNISTLDNTISQVWGVNYSFYMKRDGASGGQISSLRQTSGFASTGVAQFTTASYAWYNTQSVSTFPASSTEYGSGVTVEALAATSIGLRNSSANPTRLSAVLMEVAVTNDPAARPHTDRVFLAGCDTGDISEFSSTSGTAPTASTTVVRTGTYSVKATAAAATISAVNYQLPANSGMPTRQMYGRAYFYLDTAPTSGNIAIFEARNASVSRNWMLGMNSSRQLAIWGTVGTAESISSTPARGFSSTIFPLGQWVRVEFFHQDETSSAANDGLLKIWVDDVLVFDYTDVDTFVGTTALMAMGIARSSSGNSPVVYVDDVVFDYNARVRTSKVLDYVPTAVGSFTGTNWTTGAGSGLVSPVAETPVDGDTSYLVSPNNTTDALSWAVGDLPSEATLVHAIQISYNAKRDGASNGGLIMWPYVNNQLPTSTSGNSASGLALATGASYAWTRKVQTVTPLSGGWTTGYFNGMQLYMRSSSANKSRVSNARVTVEYVETSVGYKELSADGYIKAASRTKQVRADGYVVDTLPANTRTKQVTADAVVRNDTPPVAMPSRMYLTSSQTSYYTNLQNGDWDVVSPTVRKISETSGGNMITRTVYKTLNSEQNVLIYQGVSDPIQGQVCQGSLRFMIATKEQRDVMDNVLMVHAWITQGNSDMIRGVLLDNYTWDLTTDEWSTNTDGLAKALFVEANVTPVTASTGDRLIVEIGYRSMGTFKGYGQITYGGDYGTYGELEEGENRNQGVAYLEWGGAIPIEDEPTTVPTFAELDADAEVIQVDTLEVTADAIVDNGLLVDALEITADGVVFATQTLSVTASAIVSATPTKEITADALVVARVNVARSALGATATVISNWPFDGSGDAAALIDDNDATHWDGASNPTTDDWAAIDLQSSKTIVGWRIYQKYALSDPHSATEYKLQQSSDGSSWTDIQTRTAVSQDETVDFSSPVTARYFRFYATNTAANGASWSLNTVELYAETGAPTTQTKEVTADALVQISSTLQITGSGLVQDTIWTDIAADGLVQDSQAPEVTADAIVQEQDHTKEITGSGIVIIQGQTLDVTGTGIVFAADQTKEITADAEVIVEGATTNTKEVTADAYVIATQTKEITATGLVSSTTLGTKLYLTNLSPAWSGSVASPKGSWNVNGFQKILASEDKSGTTASGNKAVSETMAVNPTNVGVLMVASPPISSTVTIGGMLDFVIGARESSSNANMVFKIHAWVSVGNSTTVRGTLISNWIDLSTNELDVTQGRGPAFQIPITSVTAQAGDYIIFEIGVSAQNTATTNYTATMYYGANSPSGDDLTVGSFNYTSEFGYLGFTDNLPFTYTDRTLEVTADAVVNAPKTIEITTSGLVKATQNKEITANAVVFATNTAEVSASAILQQQGLTTQITADGLIQEGGQLEVSADALVQAAQILETTADAIIFATQSLEVDASALVQETRTFELDGTAILQDTLALDVPADALVQDTVSLDLTASAVVFAEQVLAITTDAILQATIEAEVTADAYIVEVRELELTASAIVQATATAELTADGLLVGQPGTLRGRVIVSNPLTAVMVVTAPLEVQAVTTAPLTMKARVDGSDS